MKVERKMITVGELCEGYTNNENEIENAVTAYGGKLCVRPAFQRSFVYNPKQANEVINTVLKGFPLNIMYWVDNGDGTYDCLDGQQRTISLCDFVSGTETKAPTSFYAPWICGPDKRHKLYFSSLERNHEERAKAFKDYQLEVFICKGSREEQLDWFKIINIAGAELSPQELRNANFVSPWLTDAKKYFSRSNPSSTAKCPAERIGGNFTNKNANRQEILAQVISWHANCDLDDDVGICNYMESHINDSDANELWQFFNNVINWASDIFVEIEDKGLATVNWGALYHEYHDKEFDPEEMCATFRELINAKALKELDISKAKIIEYCFSRNEELLKIRKFNDVQRSAMYNRQNGCCAHCGKHFDKKEMEAHHIVPWYNGGATDITNGEMICKECHTQIHL
jgi:hypothetical protein